MCIRDRSDYVGPVNIGSQAEISMKELAEKIIRVSGSNSDIVFRSLPPDDPKVRRPDTTLAEKVLAWTTQVSVEEGLRRTCEYFLRELTDSGLKNDFNEH